MIFKQFPTRTLYGKNGKSRSVQAGLSPDYEHDGLADIGEMFEVNRNIRRRKPIDSIGIAGG
jgi:hypothetical protein